MEGQGGREGERREEWEAALLLASTQLWGQVACDLASKSHPGSYHLCEQGRAKTGGLRGRIHPRGNNGARGWA